MKIITAEELKTRLDNNEVLLIDVREIEEYQIESIEGSNLIPLGEITPQKLSDKSRPIVIHCRLGKRSFEACKRLLEEDPSLDLYSLEGGIIAWQQAGFKVKRFSPVRS